MALSSMSLFHFTREYNYLIGILKDGFRVSYCNEVHFADFIDYNHDNFSPNITENVQGSKGPIGQTLHIPMVCFCDMPLSRSNEHAQKYGNYAIGLTKEWGIKNALNPVFYVARNSIVAKEFAKIQLKKTDKLSSSEKHIPEAGRPDSTIKIYDMNYDSTEIIDNYGSVYPSYLLYLKPLAENKFDYSANDFKSNNYQDEKEWRYIPASPFILNIKRRYHPSTRLNYWANMDYYQKKLLEDKPRYNNLLFNYNDISYIIVQKDSEVSNLQQFLITLYPNLSNIEYNGLITKVNSLEKLRKDVF